MSKYIDIDSLGIGKASRDKFLVPEYADGWNDAIDVINNQPGEDVAPVVHGEWEYIGTDKMGNVFRCSNCANRIGLDKETDYCPNCGAKMDGKERKE